MKPSFVRESLKVAFKANVPCFMFGSPGIGKSAVVKQVTKELDFDIRDVRVSQLDPVDMRGLPYLKENRAHWAIPEFLPTSGKGILFLDELSSAPPAVQAACYQLVLDRKLGEYEVPKDWRILAAGNKMSDKAVVARMSTALSSRFMNIDFDADLDDWCDWAFRSQVAPEVIAFLRFKSNLLHAFDPASGARSFPCPRTWVMVSDILKVKPAKDIESFLYSGCVGEGACAEFLGFLRIWRSLPSPDAILMDPAGGRIPDDPATKYALCTSLASKASDVNMDAITTYANRLEPEFNVMLVHGCIKSNPDVQQTHAFIKWGCENKDVLI